MSTAPQVVQVNWDAPEILALVRAALDEDLGVGRTEEAGDLTANCLVSADAAVKARIVAKRELVLAGLPLAERVFRAPDHHVKITARADEGAFVPAGALVAQIEGNARAIRRRPVGGECAPVAERREPGQRKGQDPVPRASARVRHEAHAAGVVLGGRVVERRRGGGSAAHRRCLLRR